MSPQPTVLAVPWPPLQLGEAGWRRRLEAIADQAEALVGRPCALQQTAEMALELVGLIWPALGPETIAATARASLLLGQPVLMASAPADQLQEVAERLDGIWQQAQADPAAGVVSVPAPLLQQVQKPQTRKRRSGSQVEPEDVELPEPWRSSEPQPWPPLEPAEPDPLPAMLTPDSAAPQPQPAPPTSPPPTSWLTGGETAELLNITRATVANWRRSGRMGTDGSGWIRHGRTTYFAPDAIERLEQPETPAGFDQLIAEVQAQ
jgi:hypothetical protein